jgi:hypothetical protein
LEVIKYLEGNWNKVNRRRFLELGYDPIRFNAKSSSMLKDIRGRMYMATEISFQSMFTESNCAI